MTCGTATSPVSDAKGPPWELLRTIAFVYMLILLAAASLNYIPGLTDAEGRAFGVFALDIFDDAPARGVGVVGRHRAPSCRAAPRASSCATSACSTCSTASSGWPPDRAILDLGIVNHGVLDLPLTSRSWRTCRTSAAGRLPSSASVRFADEAR